MTSSISNVLHNSYCVSREHAFVFFHLTGHQSPMSYIFVVKGTRGWLCLSTLVATRKPTVFQLFNLGSYRQGMTFEIPLELDNI